MISAKIVEGSFTKPLFSQFIAELLTKISALKFGLVPVLNPSGLEPGTKPVLILLFSYRPGTGPVKTGPPQSLLGSQTGFNQS